MARAQVYERRGVETTPAERAYEARAETQRIQTPRRAEGACALRAVSPLGVRPSIAVRPPHLRKVRAQAWIADDGGHA
jgi:hypothetical protein